MNERQVNMYASGEPSAVSRAGWKFASLPVKNRMNNILPFTDVLLVDEEQQGHIHVSRAVLDALHENKSYLERFDATGEGVYFIDLVTVRGHKIGAPVCVE